MKKKQIFNIILFWILFLIGLAITSYGIIGLFQYDIVKELMFVIAGFTAWGIAGDIIIEEEK